jgi:hypothetical protein
MRAGEGTQGDENPCQFSNLLISPTFSVGSNPTLSAINFVVLDTTLVECQTRAKSRRSAGAVGSGMCRFRMVGSYPARRSPPEAYNATCSYPTV